MIKKTTFQKYGQYTSDVFEKLNFPFQKGKKLLDVGCGGGADDLVFIQEFGLETQGIDIYKNPKINKIKKLKFSLAGIYNIPFNDNTFDYVFLHDILHHIDEEKQDPKKHLFALRELKRVVKKGGNIIIVEGNRFNPLFYPHMVKMLGHEHFNQAYFKRIIKKTFSQYEFYNFEAHLYPPKYIKFWKFYEKIMESVFSKRWAAYNVCIITK